MNLAELVIRLVADVLKHGSVGAPQPFVSAGAPGTSEQPIGRAAASQAALMMAGALGGAQQLPNMMVPAQGPLQTMSAPPALVPGNGGTVAGTDALTNHLAGMSKHQLYEIMSQMKVRCYKLALDHTPVLAVFGVKVHLSFSSGILIHFQAIDHHTEPTYKLPL